MNRTATGRKDTRDDTWVVMTRTFRAPIDDVWAAVTEPARLQRWIGTWDGDPATGHVAFRMTAEGDDAPAQACAIEDCRPPRLLRLRIGQPGGEWLIRLELTEADGVTTLDFAQQMTDPELASSVGPGWEYYLDRLVADHRGADVAAVSWDDYYPALSDHYRTLVG